MGCHPKPIDFHSLIFLKMVKTTNQIVKLELSHWNLGYILSKENGDIEIFLGGPDRPRRSFLKYQFVSLKGDFS